MNKKTISSILCCKQICCGDQFSPEKREECGVSSGHLRRLVREYQKSLVELYTMYRSIQYKKISV